MKLENEFTVAAPLERTWATLLDIERVATCLPGARLEAGDAEGLYKGEMKLKLGPMSMSYQGTARLSEVDDDARITTLDVQGRDAKGAGTAAATIQNRLEAQGDDSTRVIVETDLKVTGRPAQFGRGIMEDVAGKMLGDFAKRLEAEILSGPAAEPAGEPATATTAAATPSAAPATTQAVSEPREASEALDLGSVVSGPLVKYAAPGGAGLVLLLLGALLGRRRSRRGIELRYRW